MMQVAVRSTGLVLRASTAVFRRSLPLKLEAREFLQGIGILTLSPSAEARMTIYVINEFEFDTYAYELVRAGDSGAR